jgi:predicted transcriptional regulator
MSEPDLPSRRAIYQTIRDVPGIHFRALVDEVAYVEGTVQYHLRQLADEGLIEESDDGKFTRYYPADEFDDLDRAVMNALRREYARRIVARLAADGPHTTTELADALGKSASTVSWHLSKLADADLVEKRRDGRRVEYDLTDPDRVRYLYTIHRKSFTDRVVDRLFDLFDSY